MPNPSTTVRNTIQVPVISGFSMHVCLRPLAKAPHRYLVDGIVERMEDLRPLVKAPYRYLLKCLLESLYLFNIGLMNYYQGTIK